MNQRKLVKCSICNNLKSDWCEKVKDSPDKYCDRNCEYFSLKTHGDKLRETEDDKLAELFARFCAGQQGCSSCPMYRSGCPGNPDIYGWLEWMQSPAIEYKGLSLEDSFRLLEMEYRNAVKNPIVRNPLAYALYHVWRKADGQ